MKPVDYRCLIQEVLDKDKLITGGTPIEYIVGKVMKLSNGQANPKVVVEILRHIAPSL